MPGYSRFATAPRPWASVLLGNGLFLKDDKTAHRDSKDRELRSIIPDTENFLQIRPSIGCQQYWPLKTTSTGKTAGKSESVVFLVVCTGHACYDKRIVTEVGFTIFDTRERWVGGKYGAKSRARTEGCMALGDRGKNLVRLYDSHHYIVADTADHHNGTCADGRHNEKPFDFCYKKSSVILRRQLNTTLETAFSLAAKKGLDDFDIRWGKRRLVVLLSWGDELSDAISKTKWFKDTSFAEHWDVSEHQVLKRIFPRGITFANALRAFGVPHTVGGFDIAQNCGNKSSFIMQLFWAMTLATAEQIKVIKHSKDGILKPWGSPGVESVLTRDNLPPGSKRPGPGRIEYRQPPRPAVDSYRKVVLQDACTHPMGSRLITQPHRAPNRHRELQCRHTNTKGTREISKTRSQDRCGCGSHALTVPPSGRSATLMYIYTERY